MYIYKERDREGNRETTEPEALGMKQEPGKRRLNLVGWLSHMAFSSQADISGFSDSEGDRTTKSPSDLLSGVYKGIKKFARDDAPQKLPHQPSVRAVGLGNGPGPAPVPLSS